MEKISTPIDPIDNLNAKETAALANYLDGMRDALKEFVSSRTSLYMPSLVNGFNLDEFIRRKGFKTIDQMLLDDQIHAILDLKKTFMLSTGYKFVFSKTGESSEILEFVQYNYESAYNKLLLKDLYQLLSAHEYGHALAEKIYERRTTKEFGDKIFNTGLRFAPPHSIDFFTDEFGVLSQIVQRSAGNFSTLELPIWKMLRYVKYDNFDNPYGQSELSRCYRAWFLKDKIISFWAIYLQKFASPFPIGKVPQSFNSAKTSELLGILESIQQSFAAVVPSDVEIEFLKNGGNSSSEYDTAIERFNQMIGRSLLLPDLVGFGSSTHGGGSEALGKVQFKLFLSTLEYERKVIENLFNKELLKPLVDSNFGPQDIYPEFKFLPFQDESLAKMLELFIKVVDLGLPVTKEDYNMFRKKIDFPEFIEGSELIKKQESNKSEEVTKGKMEDSKGEMAAPEEPEEPEYIKKFSKMENYEIFRTPLKYEARIDFVKEFEELYKKEEETINELSTIFKKIRDSFIRYISDKKIVDNGDLKAVNGIQLKNLAQVEKVLKESLWTTYKFGVNEAKSEIVKLKKEQSNTFSNFGDLFVSMDEAEKLADELITELTYASVGNIKNELLGRLKMIMISAIQQGKGTSDIVNEIIEVFNGYVEGQATESLRYDPWLITNIVRTNMTNFYNLARRQVADSPELGGFIEMFMYSAIIDKRTTERCRKLDKFIARKTDPIWNSITPPNHYQCRSMLRYITSVDVAVDKIVPSPAINLQALRNLPGGAGFII